MKTFIAMVGFVLIVPPAAAQDRCQGDLSAEQIRACLAPPLVTRGFGPRTRGIVIEGQQALAAETSVNLRVNFEFNSARLSNDGMISLDALGQALSDPSLRNERFRIAGHTDAVGSDVYNQKLSEARALAVRAYLERNFRLDANGFDVVGYGKSRLYDAEDPTAAVNRRVQITRLGQLVWRAGLAGGGARNQETYQRSLELTVGMARRVGGRRRAKPTRMPPAVGPS